MKNHVFVRLAVGGGLFATAGFAQSRGSSGAQCSDKTSESLPDEFKNIDKLLGPLQTPKPLGVLGWSLPANTVVRFERCAGTIVKFGDRADSPLYLLTNGHCIHLPGHDYDLGESEVVRDTNFGKVININLPNGQRATTDKVVYATMAGTDLAVLELKESQEALDIVPARVSRAGPKLGDEIKVAWVRSKVMKIVPRLQEASWTWSNSIAFQSPVELPHGTSGSAIVSKSGEVIAIYSTAYEDGEPCTMNNPCEIDKKGRKKTYKDRNYGQQVVQINSCVDPSGRVTLTLPGCRL